MRYLWVLVWLLVMQGPVRAQNNPASETFSYRFIPSCTGGQIIYTGQNHSLSLQVSSKNAQKTPVENSASNQHFITVDGKPLQTSLVPLPRALPASYKLSNLTVAQQKELLTGYINYELDYFKNDLSIKISDLHQEWRTLNSRLFLVWRFVMDEQGTSANPFLGQVYFSTVCFNQVLNINMPVPEIGYQFEKNTLFLDQLARSLKTYNYKYSGP